MKTNIKIKNYKIYESGYSPMVQSVTNKYVINCSFETSAKKNTIAEYIKNKTIIIKNDLPENSK